VREERADETAGAILDEVPTENSGLKFKGSAMVALASSKEEVMEKLKADIYARSEVWDFSKVFSPPTQTTFILTNSELMRYQIQIYPFKCAFRYPLET
jgi:hypothetical protein